MSRAEPRAVQLSLLQLDDYGPWTVTPEPRREPDLQALQGRLYADFADFVGGRDGYAFYDRFDNMVAVTNGIDPADHARFQERVRNRYPVTASVGVGRAATPAAALGVATRALQRAGSAQDPDRREVLRADAEGVADDAPEGVTVAHFDVVDATGTLTDRRNAADAGLAIRETALSLSRHLRSEHDCVVHFVGGDNVIAVCPDLDRGAFAAATDHVADVVGVDLQVGVGDGATATEAGSEAKRALETCRETGRRIARGVPADD